MNMFRLQTPQMLVTLFVYLEVRLKVLPESVHQKFIPRQIPCRPAAELLHRTEILLGLQSLGDPN